MVPDVCFSITGLWSALEAHRIDSFFTARYIPLVFPRTHIFTLVQVYTVYVLQFVSLLDCCMSPIIERSVAVSIHHYSFILNIQLEPRFSVLKVMSLTNDSR